MQLCISNLSWHKKELPKVIKLLKKKKINFLEYSTYNLKNQFSRNNSIKDIKNFWQNNSIYLYSMQSILFKKKNAFIFGNRKQQNIFYDEITKKIKLANFLNTKVIVFGSPKNKKMFGKNNKECHKLMIKFLKKVSLLCKKYKIVFCLEANPKIYQTEYLTETNQALNIIKKVNSRFIRLNLDLGTIISNKENLDFIVKNHLKLVGHVQISSPYLINLSRYKKHIKQLIYCLKKYNYRKIISIEMLAQKRNNLEDLNKILNIIEL